MRVTEKIQAEAEKNASLTDNEHKQNWNEFVETDYNDPCTNKFFACMIFFSKKLQAPVERRLRCKLNS